MNSDILSILALLALAIALSQLAGMQTRLRETEAKLDLLLRHLGVAWAQYAEASDEVKALAQDPKTRIQALKAYREQTGLGLKEAKAVIDPLTSPKAESH